MSQTATLRSLATETADRQPTPASYREAFTIQTQTGLTRADALRLADAIRLSR